MKKALGKEHAGTLTSMNNLAKALSNQGEYAEAEKMHRETLELKEKVLGKEHPDTLTSTNNMAVALSNQEKHLEAKKMYRETLKHYTNKGEYAEAAKMHRETPALREKVLGKEHPGALRSMFNLAVTLYRQGEYAEAEKVHRESLGLMEKVFGKSTQTRWRAGTIWKWR
ncbi:MAG: hypothetical protein M1816_004828 [Peltula sp. TS41687]|nr:MAG: hypothetical protein M1816_004828 [Peltula sp. TS41687]